MVESRDRGRAVHMAKLFGGVLLTVAPIALPTDMRMSDPSGVRGNMLITCWMVGVMLGVRSAWSLLLLLPAFVVWVSTADLVGWMPAWHGVVRCVDCCLAWCFTSVVGGVLLGSHVRGSRDAAHSIRADTGE